MDHIPLTRIIETSSHNGADNAAASSFTRKTQKYKTLLKRKLQARLISERKALAGLIIATLSQNRQEFQLEELPHDVRQRVE
uniref:Uncharacterized protein n=1 Tax=Glossina palpalis gambiensis TaxID=67801 RepID=A0A1B0BZH1_9MUSC